MKINYAILATLLLSLFAIAANTFAHRLVFHISYEIDPGEGAYVLDATFDPIMR